MLAVTAALLVLRALPPGALVDSALQDGEVDRIRENFERRMSRSLTDGEVLRLLADTRLELERFLKENPSHKDAPRATFQIAETYLAAHDYDHAAERLQRYLTQYPSDAEVPSARFALGEIHLQKEEDTRARASFEEFARLYPKDDRALMARLYVAVTLQNEQRFDEAAALLQSLREEYKARKESWSALMQLAIIYHVQEKNALARRTLEEIIHECPEKGPVEIARRHLSEYLKLGEPAPSFTEKNIEGDEISLDKLRGKVVVLYFFDPLSRDALTEAAFLRRSREEARATGLAEDLVLLGMAIGTDRKEMPLYKAASRSDWSLFFDARGINGHLAQLYDVRGLPSLTVIDRKGRIRFFNVAGRDYRHAVAKLLQEK